MYPVACFLLSMEIAINILHANRLALVIYADVYNAALAVVEESNHFALYIHPACQFALKFYAVRFNHNIRLFLTSFCPANIQKKCTAKQFGDTFSTGSLRVSGCLPF